MLNVKPTFSILVITNQRPDMLQECLKSILDQTFGDFECFVLDRGAKHTAEPIVKSLSDNRFTYIESSPDVHIVDSGNAVIKDISGKYFIHISDDDVIMKNNLELTNKAFEENPDCDIVQTGLISYEGSLGYQRIDERGINYFNNEVFGTPVFVKYDGKKLAKETWATSGIGDNVEHHPCAYPHPTGIFIRKTGIDKVFDKQGGLFLKTFVDAGYHSIAYQTNILYINIPLGLFRVDHPGRESNAGRLRWKCEFDNMEYTPLRTIATFWNCSIETSMKCIYRNGIDKEYKTYLRYDFFLNQLIEILNDNPKTMQTFQDSKIVLRHMCLSILRNPLYVLWWHTKNLVELLKDPLSFDKRVIQPIKIKIKKRYKYKLNYAKDKKFGRFETILDYKSFLEDRFQNESKEFVQECSTAK